MSKAPLSTYTDIKDALRWAEDGRIEGNAKKQIHMLKLLAWTVKNVLHGAQAELRKADKAAASTGGNGK